MAISKNVNSSFPILTFCLALKWLPETIKQSQTNKKKRLNGIGKAPSM
jgi:hypothetical protein